MRRPESDGEPKPAGPGGVGGDYLERGPESTSGPTPTEHEGVGEVVEESQDWARELLGQIGVSRGYDPAALSAASSDARWADRMSEKRGGLFIRGSSGGGSPVLNLLTRFAGLVLFAALVGLVVLGVWAARSFGGDSGDVAPVVVPVAEEVWDFTCTPARLSRDDVEPAFESVGDVMAGTLSLPTDRDELERIGATVQERGAQRTDLFRPPAGAMMARYQDGALSSISIRFARPRELCESLQVVGLLPNASGFTWRTEEESFRSGDPRSHIFFQQGGQVIVHSDDDSLVDQIHFLNPGQE